MFRVTIQDMEIAGTAEIAQLYEVRSSAVTNWRARGIITPIAVLACGPIYDLAQVERAMVLTGRTGLDKRAGRDADAMLESVRADVKRELRTQADSVRYLFAEKMARPARKITGDGRGNGRGEWDWFYQLSADEREHLSRRWLSPAPSALQPDQYAAAMNESDTEFACCTWLAAVRLVDACTAALRGRAPRFGKVTSSTGLDVGALFGPDALAYLAESYDADYSRPERIYAAPEIYELEEAF